MLTQNFGLMGQCSIGHKLFTFRMKATPLPKYMNLKKKIFEMLHIQYIKIDYFVKL